jgi:hypothetical protein
MTTKRDNQPIQIRQGDVFLIPVAKLPAGCKAIQPEGGRRFVLAHGEVTGHAHAIYEFTADENAEKAASVAIAGASALAAADEAVKRAMSLRTAQLWSSPDGEWYLEVRQPSAMRHEEHSAPTIPPGIYHAPIQVEATADNMTRRVAD